MPPALAAAATNLLLVDLEGVAVLHLELGVGMMEVSHMCREVKA